MKVRRTIASIPARSARETWEAIVDLVTSANSVEVTQLEAASSVMETVIAEEHPANSPIVFGGQGGRLVVYCAYGDDALDIDEESESLQWCPTAGDWSITAPCEAEDVSWMNGLLTSRAPRIAVHDVEAPPPERGASNKGEASTRAMDVDWSVLRVR